MKLRNRVRLASSFLSLLAILILGFSPAYAIVSLVQTPNGSPPTCSNVASCAVTFGSTVTSGNIIAAAAVVNSISVSPTFSDSRGNTWTTVCNASGFIQPCVGYANSTSSGSDTVTVTWGGSHSGGVEAYEISGATTVGHCTATGTGTAAGNPVQITTSTSCGSFSKAPFLLSAAGTASGTGGFGITPGSGFTDHSWGTGQGSQYSTAFSPPSSPTSFTEQLSSCNTCQWENVGLMLLDSSDVQTVVVTAVIPCTAFQLQCWLYPMFFVSTYFLLICGIAMRGQVSQEDLKNLALQSLTISAMLGVIIGLFSVMIPLMLVLIQVVRAIRA